MAVNTITDNEFEEIISENEKVVVKYFAGWCGSCRLLAPKFRRLSEDERFDNIHFIEVDAEHNPKARKASGVTNLPFIAIFEKGALKEGLATSKEEPIVELINNLN